MSSHNTRSSGRRSGRGPRRHRSNRETAAPAAASSPKAPEKKGILQKIIAFFSPKKAERSNGSARPESKGSRTTSPSRPARKPEAVEVTSPKVYVGNLSFDATESDLFELFKGAGSVKNAEVVSHKVTEKSKGFGFVTMNSVEEAKRAVDTLHDKEFMGRKLVVSGAKTNDRS